MAMTAVPARRPIHALPLVGWVIRDIERDFDSIWYLIVAVVSLLVIATVTWGVQVLALTALAAVPVMFAILITITRG